MNTETKFSLEDFLDKKASDLPDRPTRQLLPNGKHILKITDISQKEFGGKNALVVKMTYLANKELAVANDTPPEAGTEFEEAFFTDSESGLGAIKDYLANIQAGDAKLSEILGSLPGQQISLTSKQRTYKNKTSGEMQTGWNTVGGIFLEG